MMLTVAEALARVIALMTPVGTEDVPLAEAAGRVLAETVKARRDQPPFDASAMDGYAVRAAEATEGATLIVVGEAAAGTGEDQRLNPGEAMRIFTGAPVPEGADSILIQENARRAGDQITVAEAASPGAHIRARGGDFTIGTPLAAPRRLTPADIALLAAMNIARVPVRKRPIIALIPTGNELVIPGEATGPGQIVSSNNYGLKALLEAHGATARLLPIARDTAASLKGALDLTEGADLIVTLGGASVGDHDIVAQLGASSGLRLDFHKVAMRPGKPLLAGHWGDVPLIGLPGNPVSAMVCGHVFLRPALDALLGLPAGPLTRSHARLTHALPENGPRTHFMRAEVTEGDAGFECRVFDNQDSAVLRILGAANALALREPGAAAAQPGDKIAFIRLD